MATDLPRPASRRAVSIGYAVVGFLLGLGALPVFLVVALATRALLKAFVVSNNSADTPVLIFLTCLIAAFTLHRGSFGTCSRHPAAPLAIAIGLCIGGLCAATIGFFNKSLFEPSMAAAVLLATPAAAAGAYYGGERGVLRRFGTPQLHIGNLCAKCLYNLSATPSHTPCPECGAQVRYTLEALGRPMGTPPPLPKPQQEPAAPKV